MMKLDYRLDSTVKVKLLCLIIKHIFLNISLKFWGMSPEK